MFQLSPRRGGKQGTKKKGVVCARNHQQYSGPQDTRHGYSGPQNTRHGYSGPQNQQHYTGPQNHQHYSGPQNQQGYSGPQNHQQYSGPQNRRHDYSGVNSARHQNCVSHSTRQQKQIQQQQEKQQYPAHQISPRYHQQKQQKQQQYQQQQQQQQQQYLAPQITPRYHRPHSYTPNPKFHLDLGISQPGSPVPQPQPPRCNSPIMQCAKGARAQVPPPLTRMRVNALNTLAELTTNQNTERSVLTNQRAAPSVTANQKADNNSRPDSGVYSDEPVVGAGFERDGLRPPSRSLSDISAYKYKYCSNMVDELTKTVDEEQEDVKMTKERIRNLLDTDLRDTQTQTEREADEIRSARVASTQTPRAQTTWAHFPRGRNMVARGFPFQPLGLPLKCDPCADLGRHVDRRRGPGRPYDAHFVLN